MKIKSSGKLIIIPNNIARQIPYFEALIFTSEGAKDKIIVVSETISPRFLKIIINHIRNKQKTEFLKSLLEREFEDETIKEQLKYLGMKDMFDKLYPTPEHVSSINCNSRGGNFDGDDTRVINMDYRL